MRQSHHAVNWSLLAFIAGALALSRAAENSGFNQIVGHLVSEVLGPLGKWGILAGLFVTTVLLTEILTNNAVAIILTPVAVKVASETGIDARPLIMTVLFGASCCFANPIGYQTNLIVFGPGGYRFRDFLRVGLPMDFLLAALGILVVPWFFAF